jgi:hypothetical protein
VVINKSKGYYYFSQAPLLAPLLNSGLSHWLPGGAFKTWAEQNGSLKFATGSGAIS